MLIYQQQTKVIKLSQTEAAIRSTVSTWIIHNNVHCQLYKVSVKQYVKSGSALQTADFDIQHYNIHTVESMPTLENSSSII